MIILLVTCRQRCSQQPAPSTTGQGLHTHSRGVSLDWLHGPQWVSSTGVFDRTPYEGVVAHSRVSDWLHGPYWVSSFVNWCFDSKITWVKSAQPCAWVEVAHFQADEVAAAMLTAATGHAADLLR